MTGIEESECGRLHAARTNIGDGDGGAAEVYRYILESNIGGDGKVWRKVVASGEIIDGELIQPREFATPGIKTSNENTPKLMATVAAGALLASIAKQTVTTVCKSCLDTRTRKGADQKLFCRTLPSSVERTATYCNE